MQESRTKKTKRNIIYSYADIVVTLLFQFILRAIIIRTLGDEYLGLDSLFSSILLILSMAELGFSGAITYNLYKPIAEHDDTKVRALINYYKKIYWIIGIVIFSVGISILPFISSLINSKYPAGINIYLLYFLYLVNTSLSYFLFAYKSSLLFALQRIDLVKIAYVFSELVQYSLQVMALLLFHSYYFFIIVMILGTVMKNVFVEIVSRKKYEKYYCEGNIDSETKDDIKQRVKGLLVGSVSSVTYTTLDSIILSYYVGLSAVAIYNNYILVEKAISTIIIKIREAMQASVGDSLVSESLDKNYNDMMLWQFLFSIIATICTTCLLNLYQPFMILWMGANSLLTMVDIVLICAWFYIGVVQHAFYLYLTGTGIWWDVKWTYVVSTFSNLILNVLLGKYFGVTGVIFSTFISNLVFGMIWQCNVVHRVIFKRTMWNYQKCNLEYIGVCIICCVLSHVVTKKIEIGGLLGLIATGVISVLIATVVMYILYHRTNGYNRLKYLVINVIRIE